MSITDPTTYDEQIAFTSQGFTAPPSQRDGIRDDKPGLAARYDARWDDYEALEHVMKCLQSKILELLLPLLTDADRMRMANAARAYLGIDDLENELPSRRARSGVTSRRTRRRDLAADTTASRPRFPLATADTRCRAP